VPALGHVVDDDAGDLAALAAAGAVAQEEAAAKLNRASVPSATRITWCAASPSRHEPGRVLECASPA